MKQLGYLSIVLLLLGLLPAALPEDSALVNIAEAQQAKVAPRTVTAQAGAGEVAFTVEDVAAVTATFADWKKRGLTILQEPVQMDFGHTFVAADPDGHRLRVFVPGAA